MKKLIMKKITLCVVLLVFGVPSATWGQANAPESHTANLNRALVRLEVIQKVDLAPKRDGFLKKGNLSPGTYVDSGDVIALLDSQRERLAVRKLRAEVASLKLASENEASLRKATETISVNQLRVNELAQARSRTFIPALEMRQAQSDLKTAIADRDDARSMVSVAKQNLLAKQAELESAEMELAWSAIYSPFSGVVYEQKKYVGEAVTSADSIAVIYRLDYLSGNILLKKSEVPISQVSNLRGKVEVEISEGQTRYFPFETVGLIPRVERDGRYLVAIKIENTKLEDENGVMRWALLPGMRGHLLPWQTPEQATAQSIRSNQAIVSRGGR